MIKSLTQVIDALRPEDGRRAFWVQMRRIIGEGKYALASELIAYHEDDTDYAEQCEIVSNAIAIHAEATKALAETN